MGLTYVVRKRVKSGQPVDGEYLRAQAYIDQYINYTLRLRNADGSFSTNWFVSPGDKPDIDRRIQTSGHILEWLVFALPQERLTDADVVHSVNYLTNLLLSEPSRDWKIGPLGHALRSLRLYDRRVFAPHDEPPPDEQKPPHVAESSGTVGPVE
jgi:hypothetical protein